MKGALHSPSFTGSHSAPATSEAFEKMDASKAHVVTRANGRIMANADRDSGLAHPALLDGALGQRSIADVVATGRNPQRSLLQAVQIQMR